MVVVLVVLDAASNVTVDADPWLESEWVVASMRISFASARPSAGRTSTVTRTATSQIHRRPHPHCCRIPRLRMRCQRRLAYLDPPTRQAIPGESPQLHA